MLARWRFRVSTKIAERVFLSVFVRNTVAQEAPVSPSQPQAKTEPNYTLNLKSTTPPRLETYAVIIAHAAARTNLHG